MLFLRFRNALRALAGTALVGCTIVVSPAAQAANHALILWLGEYADPQNNLPGIDKDAAMARQMARAMQVPEVNIVEVSNRNLTQEGMARVLAGLVARMKQDDNVFIYFSGHGDQRNAAGGGCLEGLVTHEGQLFEDVRLQKVLTDLGNRASQVVMFNDSCFSGGSATKDFQSGTDDARPKFYSSRLPSSAVAGSGHRCGEWVNKVTRNLEAVPRPPRVLYLAASAANELSFATPNGSLATLAWQACLKQGDTDNSGMVTGAEMQACAQKIINGTNRRQTITLVGEAQLPLTFTSVAGAGAAPVNPLRMLENLRAKRDPSIAVSLRPAQTSLRVGQDVLDFGVTTSTAGYLYVLHVGTDGRTLDVLFPNKIDRNNRVDAGTVSLPRANWRVRAAGPAGTGYLMAVVSPVPRDFTKGMDVSGTFAVAPATDDLAKTLVVEATGAGAGAQGGRLGVSDVVAIREVK